MKLNTKVILIVLSAFTLVVLLVGCGADSEDEIDEAVAALDRAIDATPGQSPGWQGVIEDSEDELVRLGQSEIANEVAEAMGRYFNDLNTAAQCTPVLLRDRLREDFVRSRAKLTQEELQLSPVFCPPSPNVVRFIEVQDGSVDSIEISGYNLDFADVQVFLVDANNQQTDVSRFLVNSGQYLLTLDLGGNGVPLTSSSSKLLFVLEEGNTKSVDVLQPTPLQ